MQNHHPRLRPIEVHPIQHEGKEYLMLRDPLRLTEQTLFVPRPLAPVLALCDGMRDEAGICAVLSIRSGQPFPLDIVRDVIQSLDQACLLENERYQAAYLRALDAFRSAEARPPVCAGNSYPADAQALRDLLDGWLDGEAHDAPDGAGDGQVCGVISPHIDYARGGMTYARAWKQAATAVISADLAVIFGTDHNSMRSLFTLTRQAYSTPLGRLETDAAALESLVSVLGEENAFAEELNHRGEHSVELAAVWLQRTAERQGGKAPAILPVLTGDILFHPRGEDAVQQFAQTLSYATAGKRVLYVAAADLAHVGPVFDGPALDEAGKGDVRAADEALIEQMQGGDASGFLEEIRRQSNRYNVCGVSPIYLAMRLSAAGRGRLLDYAQCPADAQGTSIVSICGMLLENPETNSSA